MRAKQPGRSSISGRYEDVYEFTLTRNGQMLKSIKIYDSGLSKYGVDDFSYRIARSILEVIDDGIDPVVE